MSGVLQAAEVTLIKPNRRRFLRAGGAWLAAAGAASVLPPGLLEAAPSRRRGTGGRLFFIFLRGGNDGVNTVIPHGDPAYSRQSRPTLFIPHHESIDLGNNFASLHPRMSALTGLYRSGQVAFIHQVGYPGASRSHYESQRVWETGRVDASGEEGGFLGRYLRQSPSASGGKEAVPHGGEFPPLILRDAEDSLIHARRIGGAMADSRHAGPAAEFFHSLGCGAEALLSEPGLRVAGASLGSFDTHESQGAMAGIHPDRLEWVALGIRALSVALAPIWDDLLLITLSEFGRASVENARGGTAHGEASCLIAAGGAIRGGVYNCDRRTWPAGTMFSDATGEAVAHRTDFRAVFSEIFRDHMGAEEATLDAVFPGYPSRTAPSLGIVRQRGSGSQDDSARMV